MIRLIMTEQGNEKEKELHVACEQIDEERSGWSSRRDSQISVEDDELISKLND